MSDPTPAMRAVTYERDGHRCVSCGALRGLQYQHRAVEGMGGRKARPLFVEGVTSCADCNPAYEGKLQHAALKFGWKIPTWVRDRGLAGEVPVYFAWERRWCRLTDEAVRVPIGWEEAVAMMRAVYGDEYEGAVA